MSHYAPPVKHGTEAEIIEAVIGAPGDMPVASKRCADCGEEQARDADLWFVPRGTHPIPFNSHVICRGCRDRRVAESQTAGRAASPAGVRS